MEEGEERSSKEGDDERQECLVVYLCISMVCMHLVILRIDYVAALSF